MTGSGRWRLVTSRTFSSMPTYLYEMERMEGIKRGSIPPHFLSKASTEISTYPRYFTISNPIMRFTISTLLALVAGTTAVPTSSVSPRQSGGKFHAVGNLYSDGGCTSQSLIFADPIFGPPNLCAPLDRNNNVPPILSYKTISEDTGCTGKYFLSV